MAVVKKGTYNSEARSQGLKFQTIERQGCVLHRYSYCFVSVSPCESCTVVGGSGATTRRPSSADRSFRASSPAQISLNKDFGNMVGGFPGGEVGVKLFNATARSRPGQPAAFRHPAAHYAHVSGRPRPADPLPARLLVPAATAYSTTRQAPRLRKRSRLCSPGRLAATAAAHLRAPPAHSGERSRRGTVAAQAVRCANRVPCCVQLTAVGTGSAIVASPALQQESKTITASCNDSTISAIFLAFSPRHRIARRARCPK